MNGTESIEFVLDVLAKKMAQGPYAFSLSASHMLQLACTSIEKSTLPIGPPKEIESEGFYIRTLF